MVFQELLNLDSVLVPLFDLNHRVISYLIVRIGKEEKLIYLYDTKTN